VGAANTKGCMNIFFTPPRRYLSGRRRFRALFVAHQHQDFGAQGFFVELDRLFAAAVEKQIGFDSHSFILLHLLSKSVTSSVFIGSRTQVSKIDIKSRHFTAFPRLGGRQSAAVSFYGVRSTAAL